ncbi:MAG: hypothetical protein KDC54_03670 [Lewinella sp.]|nr:hypothetical protein [Lewinella sp.]
MQKLKHFCTIAFLLLTLPVWAQQQERVDYIYLRGGNFLQGTILDTVNQNRLLLDLGAGDPLAIPLDQIDRIQRNRKFRLRNARGRTVQTEGLFFEVASQLLTAKIDDPWQEVTRTNVGLQFNAGYYVLPWVSTSLGVGIDHYEELVVPVFGQVRAYWPGWATAPYLQLQSGYGIAAAKVFDRDEYDESRGGWLWYPAVGVRLATRRQVAFHLDMGYKFQRVTHEYDYPDDWWTTNLTDRLTYRSFVFRFACVF